VIITTIHGTKFNINFDAGTWERTDKTGDSGNLRTESGTFIEATHPTVGQELRLLCPPLKSYASARMIITSPIVTIEE
jgi:hypothetical protein